MGLDIVNDVKRAAHYVGICGILEDGCLGGLESARRVVGYMTEARLEKRSLHIQFDSQLRCFHLDDVGAAVGGARCSDSKEEK